MGFDKNDTGPIVVVRKKTTKVNIGIVVAVLVFFGIAALLFQYTQNRAPTTSGETTTEQRTP